MTVIAFHAVWKCHLTVNMHTNDKNAPFWNATPRYLYYSSPSYERIENNEMKHNIFCIDYRTKEKSTTTINISLGTINSFMPCFQLLKKVYNSHERWNANFLWQNRLWSIYESLYGFVNTQKRRALDGLHFEFGITDQLQGDSTRFNILISST